MEPFGQATSSDRLHEAVPYDCRRGTPDQEATIHSKFTCAHRTTPHHTKPHHAVPHHGKSRCKTNFASKHMRVQLFVFEISRRGGF